MKNKIILIVGPAGAGKSTVAKLLAQEFDPSVLIEADDIRHMVKLGYVNPFLRSRKSEEQLRLTVENVSLLANNFARKKYHVIIADVVGSKRRLDLYLKLLKRFSPVVFLLLPNKSVIRSRDVSRRISAQMGTRALELHGIFAKRVKEEKRWNVIDSSKQNPKQSVQKVLQSIG